MGRIYGVVDQMSEMIDLQVRVAEWIKTPLASGSTGVAHTNGIESVWAVLIAKVSA